MPGILEKYVFLCNNCNVYHFTVTILIKHYATYNMLVCTNPTDFTTVKFLVLVFVLVLVLVNKRRGPQHHSLAICR